jgi:hypothetical protein
MPGSSLGHLVANQISSSIFDLCPMVVVWMYHLLYINLFMLHVLIIYLVLTNCYSKHIFWNRLEFPVITPGSLSIKSDSVG